MCVCVCVCVKLAYPLKLLEALRDVQCQVDQHSVSIRLDKDKEHNETENKQPSRLVYLDLITLEEDIGLKIVHGLINDVLASCEE